MTGTPTVTNGDYRLLSGPIAVVRFCPRKLFLLVSLVTLFATASLVYVWNSDDRRYDDRSTVTESTTPILSTKEALAAENRPDDSRWSHRLWDLFEIRPLLLNPEAVLCVANDALNCTLADNATLLLLGYFDREQLTAVVVRAMDSDRWTVVANGSTSICVSRQSGPLTVCVSYLEQRKDYWLAHGVHQGVDPPLPLRAFPNVRIGSWVVDGAEIGVPQPLDMFNAHLPRSRFLQCQHELATETRRKYPENFQKTPVISDSSVDDLAHFRDKLMSFGLSPSICCGTLLGWYRECALLSHTTDMDMCFPAEQWRDWMEAELRNDSALNFVWAIGPPDRLIELRVRPRNVQVDLFAWHKTPEGGRWMGGIIMSNLKKLKWSYTYLGELCTGDLLGHLFYVPCNVEQFLVDEYGPNWRTPHPTSNFVYFKSSNNLGEDGYWTKEEWNRIYRPVG